MTTSQLSPHVAQLIMPMCDATARLLTELDALNDHDTLFIGCTTHVDHNNVSMRHFVVAPSSSDPVKPASYNIRTNWWRKIPGAFPGAGFTFKCPSSDISALVILAAVGPKRLRFADELSRVAFFNCAMRFAKMTRVAQLQASFKDAGTIPDGAPLGRTDRPPMPHQRVAAYCASQLDAYALFMEQGTGKTYATIMTIESQSRSGPGLHLIIAPKNVCTNWIHELNAFSSRKAATVSFRGNQFERTHALLEAITLHRSGDYDNVYVIASYQIAVNCIKQLTALSWDSAVLDESHFIKSNRTARSRAMLKLRDAAKRRYVLTGTPIANTFVDLYTQLEFLAEGFSGFPSEQAFRNFYGRWESYLGPGYTSHTLTGMQNTPMLQERLAASAFLLRKHEAMRDLPAKTYSVIGVEMTDEQRIAYDKLANELMIEIERDIASSRNSTVTANNVLVKLLRLAQITSGFMVFDKILDETNDELLPAEIDRFDPNPKLEELVAWLKAREFDSKTIIWCCFVQDIKSICARLALEGIKCVSFYGSTNDVARAAAVKAFNKDPTVTVFVGNPSAGGVGVNLQGTHRESKHWPQKCDTVVSYSQNWSSTTRAQGEERPRGFLTESASPTGKRETWSIQCIDFVAEESIDEIIRLRVVNKLEHASAVQDVRDILANVATQLKMK